MLNILDVINFKQILDGWTNLKKRHNIKEKAISGESKSACEEICDD